MKSVLAALLSSGLLYLSLGLNGMWFLASFALVPILWLTYSKAPAWQLNLAALAAWLAGQIYAFQCYGSVSPLLILSGVAPLTLLFPLTLIFSRIAQRRASALAALFAFPACWTAFEYLYGLVAPNGSYGSLAYRQMSAPLLIKSASLLGMYSVTLLIGLFANALALMPYGSMRARYPVVLGLSLCALNVVFGVIRWSWPQPPPIIVSAFVDKSAMHTAYRAGTMDAAVNVCAAYSSAVRQAGVRGAQFAVTSEGGIVTRPDWRAAILAPLVKAAQESGVQVIARVYERAPPADMAFAFQADRAPRSYAKRHLVPFWKLSLLRAAPPVIWDKIGPWRSARTWIIHAPFLAMQNSASV